MKTKVLIVWLLLAGAATAQLDSQFDWALLYTEASSVEVEQQQVTAQVADSAEVAPYDERVAILSVNLDKEKGYGVRLIPSEPIAWIEIHDVNEPFPPRIQQPIDNKFLVLGIPKQVFWVSLRSIDSPPTWIKVVIGGDVPDPPDPPPVDDFTGLENISRARSQALGDPITADALRLAINNACKDLEEECEEGGCPTLPEAKRRVIKAIDDTPKDGRVEWYDGWRVPISTAIGMLNIETTPNYIAAMRAAARGL